MPEAALRFEDAHKSFGSHRVLRGLNLAIPEGLITVIIGRSGTGKSVALKLAMGLLPLDSGHIWVDGKDVTSLRRRPLRRLRLHFGMVFQNAALFDSMTVYDNVAFPLREHSRELGEAEVRVRCEDVLGQVGLLYAIDKMPGELSGGMRKRAGLARALVHRPRILLYDEPTTGLDPILTAQVDRLIRDTQDNHPEMTSVVVSHDMRATLRIADHVVMLHDGVVAFRGTPDELMSSPDPVVDQFVHGRLEGPVRLE
jgi:phospholipid/cholesterol/gamma-HCH transport system ATP-binding protein